MEKHFKRCLCLLFFKLVPDHAPRFGQTSHWFQANGAELMLYFLISVCLPGTGSQLKSGGLCALRVLKYFVRNPKDEVTRRVYTTGKTGVCHSCSHGGCHFELHICFLGENIFLAWVDSGLQSLMLVSPFQMISLGTSGYSLKIQSCTDSRQIWNGTN